MNGQMSPRLMYAGRALLAVYFLLPGIMKFVAWDLHIEMMEAHGVPLAQVLLPISGAAAIVGATALLTGRHVRLAALGFVAYILAVNFNVHDFWNLEGLEAQHELQNFIKNLGILAGCLVLAGASPSRAILDGGMLRSDKAVT